MGELVILHLYCKETAEMAKGLLDIYAKVIFPMFEHFVTHGYTGVGDSKPNLEVLCKHLMRCKLGEESAKWEVTVRRVKDKVKDKVNDSGDNKTNDQETDGDTAYRQGQQESGNEEDETTEDDTSEPAKTRRLTRSQDGATTAVHERTVIKTKVTVERVSLLQALNIQSTY